MYSESENIVWGICDVCTLALTVAKSSSHYDHFAISVPARSLLLFDWNGNISRVAKNRSIFSGRKDRGRTFSTNFRDRLECGRILSSLLNGSVASLPSPSSNIEAWPYGTSLRFAPAFRALEVCEHI